MKKTYIGLFLILSTAPPLSYSSADPIEQITVTASPHESTLLNLDSNLSVINSDDLQLIEHEHINQALSRVPGGWISRGNGQEHLTAIRSPVLTGAGGCGAFFMAQDGISLRAPGFCNTNQLFDANTEQADKIEILRGPSSALFGSNAVHGVINIITPDAFNGGYNSVGLTLGSHDYYRATVSNNYTSDEHALLFYGNAAHDGGYKDDSGFEQQKLNIIHQFEGNKLSIKNVIAATNLNQDTAGFITGIDAYKDDDLKKRNPNPEAYRDSQSFRAYSVIQYQENEDISFYATPYVRWTDMEFLQHYLPWQPIEENSQSGFGIQSSIEKRFKNVTWVAGLDVDSTQGELTETQEKAFSPSIPEGKHYDYTVDALVISPYSHINWALSKTLTLSAGIRYDQTEYDYQKHLSAGSACDSSVINCRFTRPDDQTVDYDEVSYQMGGHYVVADKHSFYAKMSKGYRAPQATELFRLQAGQQVTDLSAETIDAFELGVRGQWENLFYDVTAFAMDKENFIFQDTNRQNISDGETSHNGVEFSVVYQLPHQFYLKGNGAISNHTYDSSLTLSRVNIKGNEIDTAPQHMGSAQLGWRSDQGSVIELEWIHMGNYYLNPENTAEYEGHNLLNLRANSVFGRHWSVNARVLNLLDEDYAERADFGFGSYRYFVGEERTFFVSVKYNFNDN